MSFGCQLVEDSQKWCPTFNEVLQTLPVPYGSGKNQWCKTEFIVCYWDFSHVTDSTYQYIIENWVWLGLEVGLQRAAGPFFSSLELVLLCQPYPSRGALVRPQKLFCLLG